MPASFNSSPFISFPSKHTSASSLQQPLAYFGKSTTGELYYNQNTASFGIICASLADEINISVQRIVDSHSDAEILILHSGSSNIQRKPCPFVNATEAPVIFTSPRTIESSLKVYDSARFVTVPLHFEESTVTTQHILSLFTVPSEYGDESPVLNTMNMIFSQIREPFDLQRFIESVEKETWTEDGSSFIALRLTLLASLLSPPLRQTSPSRVTVVDINDPILHNSGLDNVMMNMALHRFLAGRLPKQRLIVLYNADKSLSRDSPLARSIEHLASLGAERPASIVLATVSPSIIPPTLFNSLDYMVIGFSRSTVWQNALRDHFGINFPTRNQLAVWSPNSQHFPGGFHDDASANGEEWEESQVQIEVEALRKRLLPVFEGDSMPGSEAVPVEEAEDLGCHARQELKPTHAMLNKDLSMEGEGETVNLLTSIHLHNNDPVPEVHDTTSSQHIPPVSTAQLFTPILPSAETSGTNQPKDISAYWPLISAFKKASRGDPDALVDVEVVRATLDENNGIQKLEWWEFATLIQDARQEELLEVVENRDGHRFIRLLTSSKSLDVIPTRDDRIQKPATPTNLDLSQNHLAFSRPIPAKYRPLIDAILKVGNYDSQCKVSFEAVDKMIGKTKAEIRALGYGWVSYPHWVQKAHEAGWVQQGGFLKDRWLMIGPKLPPKPEVSTSSLSIPAHRVGMANSSSVDLETKSAHSDEELALLSNQRDNSKTEASVITHSEDFQTSLSEDVPPLEPNDLSLSFSAQEGSQSSRPITPDPLNSSTIPPSTPQGDSSTMELSQTSSRAKDLQSKSTSGDFAPLMVSGSALTRRVSTSAYPRIHHDVIAAMLTLCGGKTHIGVAGHELSAALSPTNPIYLDNQALSTVISNAVKEEVLQTFKDGRGEVCFLLENPVALNRSKSWLSSMGSWF